MATFQLGNTLCDELDEVEACGSFHQSLIVNQLVEYLKNDLKGVDINSTKFKPSFIKYILDKVKTLIKNTDQLKKEQLKDLSVQVIKLLVPGLSDSDIRIIDDVLDVLITNKLIKAIDKSIKGRIKSVFSPATFGFKKGSH